MDLANGIVAWDGQDDPLNPKNFPSKLKWTILALVSSITLVRYVVSPFFHYLYGLLMCFEVRWHLLCLRLVLGL
jgi:hypothetical protein